MWQVFFIVLSTLRITSNDGEKFYSVLVAHHIESTSRDRLRLLALRAPWPATDGARTDAGCVGTTLRWKIPADYFTKMTSYHELLVMIEGLKYPIK